MKSAIVPVKNVQLLTTAAKSLQNRARSTPGVCVVDGYAGYGKSLTTHWLSLRSPSVYVRAIRLWTPNSMLSTICRGLRLPAGGGNARMVEEIALRLSAEGRALYVDESDYLARNTALIETLRDIHDLSEQPLILIGEETLMQRLVPLKRFSSRIAEHVTFQPLDVEDTSLLARDLCEVEVKADLLAKIHSDTRGNARNTVVSLAQCEKLARAKGRGVIGLADVDAKKALFSGAVAGA